MPGEECQEKWQEHIEASSEHCPGLQQGFFWDYYYIY